MLMLKVFAARQQIFTIGFVVAVDSGFQLTIIYREMDWLDAIRWQAWWQIRQVETDGLFCEKRLQWVRKQD